MKKLSRVDVSGFIKSTLKLESCEVLVLGKIYAIKGEYTSSVMKL